MPDPCLFCKIIKGEIPSHKVAENDLVFSFLDINPINAGHVLVVPKAHHENILDTPPELLTAAITMCKSIAKAQKDELGAEGINIGMNNFPAAGQAVFHAHFHVIPRFVNDGLHPWPHKTYQDGQGQEIAKRLSKNIKY